MSNENNLPELPKGWVWTDVGSISDVIHYGYTASATNEPIGPRMLRITDIQNNSVNWVAVPYCQITPEEEQKYLLKAGDLVFARTGATVGKSFLIKGNIPEAVFASYLIRIILSDPLEKDFVYYFFQSNSYWLQIYEGQLGIGQPNVNSKTLSKIVLPLPSFAEQHRIVARIEELFTKLDAGIVSLKKVKAQLKRYRQSVLKYAFEGKLTEKWRETHKNELEQASKLLERIKEERKRNAKGKYKELLPEDTANLVKLPEEWVWVRLEEISQKITDGTHHTPTYMDRGVPFISVKDVSKGKISFKNCRYISEGEHNSLIKRCNPEYLDVLITKSGTIGRTAVIKTDRPFSLFVSVALIKPYKNYMDSNFIASSLENYINSIDIQQSVKGGVIKNLHIEDLKEIIIGLPPLSEQHRIVEELERRFSVADEVEMTVDLSLKQSDRLRRSILKSAFEGKLVPQNPNDEPARILLDRIKAEKQKREDQSKHKSKRKKDLGQRRFNDYAN